ncbi:MAG: tRNA pseudouridine(55) synthase TruB [Pseudomonadota bacterium]|nr:tRNA pseudouridine(55) synthase TruB [Pseudomonadota bacterium]
MSERQEHHGVVLVDKEAGCTSHDVVAYARRIFQTKAIGHAGTLDPDATGLLVLLLGEATKMSDYILCGDKGYEVGVKLGIETDTADISGQVLSKCAVTVSNEQITTAILNLTGEILLLPPMYSAIKIKGKKLYELARKQETVKLEPRPMRFYDLSIASIVEGEIKLKMRCSKGSYVRSWVTQLGKLLGCGATVLSLRRTWSEPFLIDQANSLDALKGREFDLKKVSSFIPLAECVPRWQLLIANLDEEKSLRNGKLHSSLSAHLFGDNAGNNIKVISQASGKLISILSRDEANQVRIKRVFNY